MRRLLLSVSLALAVPTAGWTVPADPQPLRTIAIAADNNGQSDIFLLRPGNDPLNLTDHTANDTSPAWSPDGKRIAFVSDRENGVPHVFVMDAAGKNLSRVTKGNIPCNAPAWSPDGKRLAFVSAVQGIDQIHAIDEDGKNVKPLTQGGSAARQPTWSPDGRLLAYARYTPNQPDEVWVVGSDGMGARSQSKGSGVDPAWSPDGKRIAFTGIRGNGGFRVYAADTDGGNLVTVCDNPNPQGAVYPRFSPDGKRVVFTDWIGEAWQIAVADADGKNHKALTNAGTNSIARWSPDGRRVAFFRGQQNAASLIVLDLASGKEEEAMKRVSGFDWKPIRPE